MTAAARAMVRLLPTVPRRLVRAVSARYIAGETLADAVQVVSALNATGKLATIDVLGEAVSREAEARTVMQAYCDVLAALQHNGLDANVSLKLTSLGLKLSYDLCRENLRAVVKDAAARNNFVRIDMEDSSTTQDTLRLYRDLREAGYDNLGVVLQARLRRTLEDVVALADLRPNVRLCKGIYLEPSALAHTDSQAVSDSFVRSLSLLLDTGCYVAIATHDESLINESLCVVSRYNLGRDQYELQMLLGVREEWADELVTEGHRLRVYVPFGDRWYQYSLRRLQENPVIASHVARATAARVLSRRTKSAKRTPTGDRRG